MNWVLVLLAITLLVSLVSQFVLVAGFNARLRRPAAPLLDDDACPVALVILCLRGGDPFLRHCVAGLLDQDYPGYEIRFMVDHVDDPAVPVLMAAIQSVPPERYRIEYLSEPLNSCSLKCSSLVQAIRNLPMQVQFIAQLDADTIPHRTWLRELATGLAPEDVGACTGNRWYMPMRRSPGSLVRHIWNAAAVVQMYWYEIAWGGTLAVKVDSIARAELVDRWKHAFCEDTMLKKQLSFIGQRVVFVPSLMMVNREDCTLGGFYHWVARQLMTARLYHPTWLAVLGHGVSSALLLLWGWLTGIFLLMTGSVFEGVLVCVAMLGFQLALMLMLPWMESNVARIVQSRGESAEWDKGFSWFEFFRAVWLTQVVYTAALLTSQFIRRVQWRGIAYKVDGPWSIRMLGYQPYREPNTGDGEHRSL